MANHHPGCSFVLDFQDQSITTDPYLKTEICITYLVRLLREVKEAQGTLKLCNLPLPFMEALRAIRLDRMFSIRESLDDALASNVPDPGQSREQPR